jgi:rod shape determining protein RodA
MFMVDTRYFRYFDWLSFALTLILLSLGLLFVFSATYTEQVPFSLFFKKQLFGALSGLVIYFFFCSKDLRILSRWGYFGYFFVLLALIYTSLMGLMVLGGKRWISLYFFKFQPSELPKLFFPSFVAYYFNEQNYPLNPSSIRPKFKEFLFPLGIVGISSLLTLKQPDLGTTLIILFVALILFWILGLDKKIFFAAGAVLLLGAPFLWTMLKPYQQQRILVLMGQGDARNERYQIEQAKIAIGSGGLYGKGFLQGTQNKFSFIPEDHSDFIFAVICEEWGFWGALLIICLFTLLFTRIITVTLQLPSLLEQTISIGLSMHIMLSVIINIGMVIGILPIVGIPLPLLSYGLTNLWVTMASLGMLNNIAIRRFYY